MIGYRLCRNKTAVHPFYLKSVSINLYTVEELCYFLYHNPFLIDDTVLNTTLTRWMAEELNMPETALLMERAMREKRPLSECILPLFQKTWYLTSAEQARYRKILDTLGSISPAERLKRKGDALAQNGKYAEAVRIYHEALSVFKEEGNKNWNRSFRAAVWYNIGAVKMQLFDYEEGTDAFYRAWKLKPEETTALSYLTALRLTVPEEKYRTESGKFLTEAAAEGIIKENSAEEKNAAHTVPPAGQKSMSNILQRVDSVIAAAREKADIRVRTEQEADPEHILEKHPGRIAEKIASEYHALSGT